MHILTFSVVYPLLFTAITLVYGLRHSPILPTIPPFPYFPQCLYSLTFSLFFSFTLHHSLSLSLFFFTLLSVLSIKDVRALGLKGDVVDVKPGHARNHLVPQNLALYALPKNVDAVQSMLADRAKAPVVEAKKDGEEQDEDNAPTGAPIFDSMRQLIRSWNWTVCFLTHHYRYLSQLIHNVPKSTLLPCHSFSLSSHIYSSLVPWVKTILPPQALPLGIFSLVFAKHVFIIFERWISVYLMALNQLLIGVSLNGNCISRHQTDKHQFE